MQIIPDDGYILLEPGLGYRLADARPEEQIAQPHSHEEHPMANVVAWSLHLTVREGKLDELRTLMAEMLASTQDEPGTLMYEWYLSEDQSTCHLYERYTNSVAVLAHLGAFGARFAKRFLAVLEPTALHVYGDPNEEARAALDGFNARYYHRFGGFAR